MEQLKRELKTLIIKTLELEDISEEEIVDDEPLFVEGLGLDSIDALELALPLEEKYAIKFDNEEKAKKAFFSVESLANFIIESRQNGK